MLLEYRPTETIRQGASMSPSAMSRHIRLRIAKFCQERERLRGQIDSRRKPQQRPGPLDDLAGDRTRVPGGGAVPGGLGQSLRLIQERQKEIFGLVGGKNRHERRENLVLGIMAMNDLIRRA